MSAWDWLCRPDPFAQRMAQVHAAALQSIAQSRARLAELEANGCPWGRAGADRTNHPNGHPDRVSVALSAPQRHRDEREDPTP